MEWLYWCQQPWFHVILILLAVGVFIHLSKALHHSVNVNAHPTTVQHDTRQIEGLISEAQRLQQLAASQVQQPIQRMVHLTTAVTLVHTALHLLPLNYNQTTVLTPLQQLNTDLLHAHEAAVNEIQRLLPQYPPVITRFLLF